MIYPSIEDLTKGKYNRYELVIATAKCARIVTDEYIKQRETAEKLIADKQTDKSLSSMIKREYRDEKAVKNAINRLYSGEFVIVQKTPEQIAAEQAAAAEAAARAAEEQAAAAAAALAADSDEDEADEAESDDE